MKPAIRRQRHVWDGGAGAIAGHCYARRRIRMEPPPGPESCTAFRNVRSTSRSIDFRRQQFCPGMDDAGHGFPGKILRYDGVSIADICTGRDPRFPSSFDTRHPGEQLRHSAGVFTAGGSAA